MTSDSAILPFKLGAYAGRTAETTPQVYRGKIQFVVHRQSITGLAFTVGVVCNGVWAIESDTLTKFSAKIRHGGAFSYSGTTQGRRIHFKGRVKSGRATGLLSQTFRWGSELCSMGPPASFTATR